MSTSLYCIVPPTNSGPYARATRAQIPLKEFLIDVQVNDMVAELTYTMNYKNEEDKTVEAFFTFPTPAESSVYGFTATVGDKVIVCEIKEKAAARKEYNEAIEKKEGAYLLERDFGDTFSCAIGNMLAGQETKIEIKICYTLPNECDGTTFRLTLPVKNMPKYTPGNLSGSGRINNNNNNVSPAAISPVNNPVNGKPYNLQITGTIHMSTAIEHVQPINMIAKISHVDQNTVSFTATSIVDDKDQIITIKQKGCGTFLYSERTQKTTNDDFTFAHIYNVVATKDQVTRFRPEDTKVIFLADVSGSMESNMAVLREALTLGLVALPTDVDFEMYAFESNFYKYQKPVTTDLEEGEVVETDRQHAFNWINNLKSLGGTEVYPVMVQAIKDIEEAGKTNNCIIFLTDGGISNTQEVLDLVSDSNIRIFSLGIGNSVSRDLVMQVSKITCGVCEFVTNAKEDLLVKMNSQISKVMNATIRPTINIKGSETCKWSIVNNSKYVYPDYNNPSYIFSNEPITIDTSNDEEDGLIYPITGAFTGEPIHKICGTIMINNLKRSKRIVKEVKKPQGSRLAHLQVKEDKQKELEKELETDPIKDKIIEVSINCGVICEHTSFIGVEKRDQTVKDNTGDAELREVPQYSVNNNIDSVDGSSYNFIGSVGMSGPQGSCGPQGTRGMTSAFCMIPKAMAASSFLSSSNFSSSNQTILESDYDEDEDMAFGGFDSTPPKTKKVMKLCAEKMSTSKGKHSNKKGKISSKALAANMPPSYTNYGLSMDGIDCEMIESSAKSTPKPKYNITCTIDTLDAYHFTISATFYKSKTPELFTLPGHNLQVKDYIEVTQGPNKGIYQIISLGSDTEHWILKKVE